jgi:hypothetical protein
MRFPRLILTLVLAAAIAPGTWVRSPLPPEPRSPFARIAALPVQPVRAGPFVLEGAWHLTGEGRNFGGYSALVALPGDRLLAGSDGGRKLVFMRPDREDALALESAFGAKATADKTSADLESLTRDPATGLIWAGYEGTNSIRRFGPDLEPQASIAPQQMRDWGSNSGPETFTRLHDGRFVVIEEGETRWFGDRHQALVFPGDPLLHPQAQALEVEVPEDYRPVDLLDIGGGHVLVLLRRLVWSFPPGFDSAIGTLAITDLQPGKLASVRIIARLGAGFPHDNYEGLALTDDGAGRTALWLISDDNKARYQRTLVLKLGWARQQKARE